MKVWVGSAVAAIALCGAANTALANSNCSVSGLVEGGGGYEAVSLGAAIGPFSLAHTGTGGPLAFGELAMAYNCGNWGMQLDGALHDHWAKINTVLGGTEVDLDNPQGHIGGALYLNDTARSRYGIAGSYIFNSTGISVPALGGNLFSYKSDLGRIGLVGEYYPSDAWMVGGGAFFVAGNSSISVPVLGSATVANHSGFEGDLYAKYYAKPNLSLGLRGDLMLDTMDFSPAFVPLSLPLNGGAITAEAEYLVPNSALSFGVGARYAYRQLGPLTIPPVSGSVSVTDQQAFLTVKYTFGGAKPTSLAERDRRAPIDNTSVMHEKLPSFFNDIVNAALTP